MWYSFAQCIYLDKVLNVVVLVPLHCNIGPLSIIVLVIFSISLIEVILIAYWHRLDSLLFHRNVLVVKSDDWLSLIVAEGYLSGFLKLFIEFSWVNLEQHLEHGSWDMFRVLLSKQIPLDLSVIIACQEELTFLSRLTLHLVVS